MVEHQRTLVDRWHLDLTHGRNVFSRLRLEEVLCKLRVFSLKLCEFFVRQRLIESAFPQCGQHVAAWDLLLVDFWLLLLRLRRLFGLRLFLSVVDCAAVLLQNFQNLAPVVPASERGRSLSALVFVIKVDALLD